MACSMLAGGLTEELHADGMSQIGLQLGFDMSWSDGSAVCRPHHEELHGWANQLLLSKSVLLEALQQQVEKQAAMTELIRKIREPEALAVSMPPAPRTHQPPMLEPPSPSASLSIDRDFAHGKVTSIDS